jgi:hypothetical protein
VHEPDACTVGAGITVEADSLDKRAGAVAHTDDCDSDFTHGGFEKRQIAPSLALGQDVKLTEN